MKIRNAIVAAVFTVGFAVTEVVMIDEPNAIHPVRERASTHAYGRPMKQTKEGRAQHKVNTAIKLLGQAAKLGHSGAKKSAENLALWSKEKAAQSKSSKGSK